MVVLFFWMKIVRQHSPNVRHQGQENKMTELGDSEIFYSDDRILGKGETSIVYSGHFKCPQKRAAIKRVLPSHVQVCEMEIRVWLTVNDCVQKKENVNIVQLYHWTDFEEVDGTAYYFAMERATCNLDGWLKQIKENRDPKFRQKIIVYLNDVVSGLSWLHHKEVIHRDIKPQNILIFCDNDDTNEMGIAKLGDFGISKLITGPATGTDSNGKGTLVWMPPEALNAMKNEQRFSNTKAIDIFSLGCTAHYSVTKGVIHPFGMVGTCSCNSANISREYFKPSMLGRDESTADHLFQWMMAYEPTERPKIDQVMSHPFFWSFAKQLCFVVDVAISLDNPRNYEFIDEIALMNGFYLDRHPTLNWKEVLGSTAFAYLMQRKFPINEKKKKNNKNLNFGYDEKSVFSLIKLIRDKVAHKGDLIDTLITEEYFGVQKENGKVIYCEEKFAEFFFKLFPDLVIFLFVFLVNEGDLREIQSVQAVKFKFGLNKFWAPVPLVAKY